MLGRNGMDELNYALLWAYLALCVVRAVIVWLTRSAIAGGVFDVIADIAAIAMLYRVLSRNLPKRQGENLRFLNWRKRAQRLSSLSAFMICAERSETMAKKKTLSILFIGNSHT